ncbi:MAG: hypothetical protein E3J21_00235 [Anaerolineales bacterium]|nr:MAG: hypothetical protein E3J21_00235 [Anaerolineales bacterium]
MIPPESWVILIEQQHSTCPITLPANDFYARTGWSLAGSEPGKRRPLNLWQLALDTSDDATVGL